MAAEVSKPTDDRRPDASGSAHATEAAVLAIVGGLLAELHGRSQAVALGDDLERRLGLGSLERAELIVRLEDAFSISLPETTLAEARSPSDLLNALRAARGSAASSGAVPPPGSGTAPESAAPRNAAPENEAPESATSRPGDPWQVPSPEQAGTLVDIARYRADHDGSRLHVRFLGDDGTETVLTYAQLWDRARRVAEGLAVQGLRPGDRVALVLPTGEDFFAAFLGIQCAAAIPVPIYPPIRLDQLGAYLERHANVLRDAGTRGIVCDRKLKRVADLLRDRVPGLDWTTTVTSLVTYNGVSAARVEPGELGLIQYTSGSTGHPKGVALSHRNLLANMHAIGKGLGLGPGDVAVSWVPLYHDMGLIGCWMTALLYATPVVMMSPLRFLSRPEHWLWAIDRHRGTVAPSPNFGYELCTRRVREEAIEGLDLSRWRLAINGAEAVLPGTIERFAERFAPYGFQRRAMFPVYGLAETCLGLTVPPRDRGPRYDHVDRDRLRRDRRAISVDRGDAKQGDLDPKSGAAAVHVSVGSPLDTQEVRIVCADRVYADRVCADRVCADRVCADRVAADPGDSIEDLPERTEGRILMRGPSVMEGYFRQPEATAAVREGSWTDTGDLGYLADGELYITGRIKDVLIKAGRNYHPQDLEQAAAVEGIRRGCVIAFDVPAAASAEGRAAGEAIVVVAEVRDPGMLTRAAPLNAALKERIVATVLEETGAPVDRVVLVAPGTVLKTSSGKLRRRETRELYLAGALKRSRESPWILVGILAGALATRLRAFGAKVMERVYSLYASAVVVKGTVIALLWVGFFCSSRAAAWKALRRSLRWIFAAARIPVRRFGPALPESSAIVVSNHTSYLDAPFLILALDRPLTFTAKHDLFSVPVLGRVLRKLGCVSVDRRSGAGFVDSYGKALAAADAGSMLHIFPEGTFTPAAGVRPFRLGAFQLAAEKSLEIVPVAIRGARSVLRDRTYRIRRAAVEIEVLPTLEPPQAALRAVATARTLVREALTRASGEPALEITSAALPRAAAAQPGSES